MLGYPFVTRKGRRRLTKHHNIFLPNREAINTSMLNHGTPLDSEPRGNLLAGMEDMLVPDSGAVGGN